jgi:hypothetical protein
MLARNSALRLARLLRRLLGPAQHDLGPLALDHPPELGADVGHHAEQRLVRLEGLAGEELQDGDDLVPDQHGKAEAGLMPVSAAALAREKSGSSVTSAIQTGLPLARTRPGSPATEAMRFASVAARNDARRPGSARCQTGAGTSSPVPSLARA